MLPNGWEWKDLPERQSDWKSVHKRYIRWPTAGIWKEVLEVLPDATDNLVLCSLLVPYAALFEFQALLLQSPFPNR